MLLSTVCKRLYSEFTEQLYERMTRNLVAVFDFCSQESEITMEEKRMEKLRNRQMCLEQRKIMEKERRKAINAARKRQREMRNALSQVTNAYSCISSFPIGNGRTCGIPWKCNVQSYFISLYDSHTIST